MNKKFNLSVSISIIEGHFLRHLAKLLDMKIFFNIFMKGSFVSRKNCIWIRMKMSMSQSFMHLHTLSKSISSNQLIIF